MSHDEQHPDGEFIPWDRLLPGSNRDPEALDEVLSARSSGEAQVVAALLRAAGIPLYVDGQLLQDEFAMSQAISGGVGRKIMVPASRAEDARRVIETAREQGRAGEDEPA